MGGWFLGRGNPEQGDLGGLGRQGGLEVLSAPFPKLPGVFFEGREGGATLPAPPFRKETQMEPVKLSQSSAPSPSLAWSAQPKTRPWGRWGAGRRDGGRQVVAGLCLTPRVPSCS